MQKSAFPKTIFITKPGRPLKKSLKHNLMRKEIEKDCDADIEEVCSWLASIAIRRYSSSRRIVASSALILPFLGSMMTYGAGCPSLLTKTLDAPEC